MNGSTRFLRVLVRARRRQRVGCVADAALTAAVVGLTAGLVLTLGRTLGWLTFVPDQTVVVIALIVGGVRWIFSDPITFAKTAQSLDHLNQTRDLLATAWFVRINPDPWDQTILDQAETLSDRLILPSLWGRYPPSLHLATWSAVLAVGMILLLMGSVNSITPAGREDLTSVVNSPSSGNETWMDRPRVANSPVSAQSVVPESIEESLTSGSSDSRSNRPDTGHSNATGSGRDLSGIRTEWETGVGQSDPVPTRGNTISDGSVAGGRESLLPPDASGGATGRAGVSDTFEPISGNSWNDSLRTDGSPDVSTDGGVFHQDLPPDRRAILKRYFDR